MLTTDVDKLGAKGDLVTVQNGYMFNYLFPQGLAKKATKDILACAPLSSLASGCASIAAADSMPVIVREAASGVARFCKRRMRKCMHVMLPVGDQL